MTTADRRVFVIDDHEVVRAGLGDLFDAAEGLGFAGGHPGAVGAVDAVVQAGANESVDVAVVDVKLGDGNGIEVCWQLSQSVPHIETMLLTATPNDTIVVGAALVGALAVCTKELRTTTLVANVVRVAQGERLLGANEVNGALRRVTGCVGDLSSLTDRERTILMHLATGASNSEIANVSAVTVKTVKNAVTQLLSRFGMQRRSQLISLVSLCGVLESAPRNVDLVADVGSSSPAEA